MTRIAARVCSAAVLAVALAPVASAQTAEDTAAAREQNWDRCADDDPDISIRGCTALIDSGAEVGVDLVNAIANRAISYGQKRDWDRAITDYERAFQLDTTNTEVQQILVRALLNRGAGHYDAGKYDEALVDFDKSTKTNPEEPLGWAWIGAVYDMRGQWDLAIENLDTSVRLDPQTTGAWFYRGVAYFGKADYGRALEDFDAAVKLSPGWPLALFARGVAKQTTGDQSGADADMTAAKTIQADVATALAKLRVVPKN